MLLGLAVEAAGLTAVAVEPDGSVVARSTESCSTWPPPPDRLWQATQDALRPLVPLAPVALGLAADPTAVYLWDLETLGSPGPPLPVGGSGAGPALASLAVSAPHTAQLLDEGVYAVGGAASYLLARLTRGTFHCTDVATADRLALPDLDEDAAPEVVATWGPVGSTDPASTLGLALPVTALAASDAAGLVGSGCVAEGSAAGPLDGPVLRVGPGRPVWRSPDGEVTTAAAVPADGLPSLRVHGPLSRDDAACAALAARAVVRVERGVVPEVAAYGAALLAGLGHGTWRSLEELAGLWRLDRAFSACA